MASGWHIGRCLPGTFSSLQEVLLHLSGLESVVVERNVVEYGARPSIGSLEYTCDMAFSELQKMEWKEKPLGHLEESVDRT